MVQGLPEDWYRATMEINLDKPFDETGSVRYAFAQQDDEPPAEPFEPCDVKRPAPHAASSCAAACRATGRAGSARRSRC